jgi:gluconolactonase
VAVNVKSEKLTELVDPTVEVEQLATGFTFTEGPIWHPTEQVLYFSDMPGDVRRKVTMDGTVTEVRRPSFKCNGMTLDAELNLVVCEHVTSSLVRERPGSDTEREILAFHYEGQYLNSGWQGVFMIPPGGGQNELALVVEKDEFEMPNGLCFSPDESLLYVNDTPRACIKVFDVSGDGTLANGRMFAEGIGTGTLEVGDLVDGMKCDERGNVWVTGPGLWIFSPEGEHLGVVEIPENIGNLTWGGPDWHTLFVPASSSVYTVKTLVGPRREPYMR